jgi:hypothetical protein
MIVAADVLYEMTYAELVADILAAALASKGTAIIADPGRIALDRFLEACAARGLARIERNAYPFVEGTIRQTITLYSVRRGAARARESSKSKHSHDNRGAGAGVSLRMIDAVILREQRDRRIFPGR